MLQIKLCTAGCRVLAVKFVQNVFSLRLSQRNNLLLRLLLPATTSQSGSATCGMILNSKTPQGTMSDSTSQPCQAATSGKFT